MKYSVIIPVYNKADTIAESVSSILAQTESDYEIIIVNDGSKDALHDALRKFDGITVIDQPNGGVSVARNTGIKAAKGEYVCFLDADDLWCTDHLSQLNELIQMYPDAMMFSTSHTETFSDGREVYSCNYLSNKYPDIFLCDNLLGLLNNSAYSVIHTNSICINRKFLIDNNILFEPGEKIGEDTDVWYRCSLLTAVGIAKKCTTVYRRENSTATKYGTGSPIWIFARRWDDIKNGDFPAERKTECFNLVERYKISTCLDYVLEKDRKTALKWLRQVKKRNKRYYLALTLTYLPYCISRYILTHR